MKPLGKFIYIQPVELENYGGIIDPAKSDKQAEKAKVLAVGAEVENIKRGDTIVYKSYNLYTLELDKKEHNFITQDEVIAKL